MILFDKRGTGLSDRIAETPDLEMRADDLRAVLDAVGSERAVVLGDADGGALAAFFAAAHPERVQALILNGAYARRRGRPTTRSGRRRRTTARVAKTWRGAGERSELAQDWVDAEAPSLVTRRGVPRVVRQDHALRRVPGGRRRVRGCALRDRRPGDPRDRAGADPRAGAAGFGEPRRAGANATWPTGSPARSTSSSRGEDFILEHANPEPLAGAIERFVRSVSAEEREIDRVLATVLFTDIVGSTEKAAELGDGAWRDLLERHHDGRPSR